jgi:hypothetical protein
VDFKGRSSVELYRMCMGYKRVFFLQCVILLPTMQLQPLPYIFSRLTERSSLTVRPVDKKWNLNQRGNTFIYMLLCSVSDVKMSDNIAACE